MSRRAYVKRAKILRVSKFSKACQDKWGKMTLTYSETYSKEEFEAHQALVSDWIAHVKKALGPWTKGFRKVKREVLRTCINEPKLVRYFRQKSHLSSMRR